MTWDEGGGEGGGGGGRKEGKGGKKGRDMGRGWSKGGEGRGRARARGGGDERGAVRACFVNTTRFCGLHRPDPEAIPKFTAHQRS